MTGNRYTALRDNSPASSIRSSSTYRSRSVSTKRKFEEANLRSYAEAAGFSNPPDDSGNPDIVIQEVIDGLSAKLVMLNSLCEKAAYELGAEGIPTAVIEPLNTIVEALRASSDIQNTLIYQIKPAKSFPGNNRFVEPMQDLGAFSKSTLSNIL